MTENVKFHFASLASTINTHRCDELLSRSVEGEGFRQLMALAKPEYREPPQPTTAMGVETIYIGSARLSLVEVSSQSLSSFLDLFGPQEQNLQ